LSESPGERRSIDLREVKAVIFDLDGVITDTAEFHYIAWKQLAEKIGISFDREFNEKLKGVSRIDSLELILAKENRQNEFSKEEKEILATEKNDHYVELIKKITPNDILEGIEEFLEELIENKIKIAMASASKNAFAVTKSLGVLSYFDHIVDARTVEKSKPDPEVFIKAAKAVEVEPKYCIGIEDAAAGVDAIKAAGMYAIGVGDEEVLKEADMVVSSTRLLNMELVRSIV
jgi:beta-phosphoglucomutase